MLGEVRLTGIFRVWNKVVTGEQFTSKKQKSFSPKHLKAEVLFTQEADTRAPFRVLDHHVVMRLRF